MVLLLTSFFSLCVLLWPFHALSCPFITRLLSLVIIVSILQRQLRCTYDISSLREKMSLNDKILAFFLIQMIPFFIPFVIMVTTSVMVYIKIKANIDR